MKNSNNSPMPYPLYIWILFQIISLGIASTLYAQNPPVLLTKAKIPTRDSTKGNNLPAYDSLRVLYVFVRFKDGEEPENGIPEWTINRKFAPEYSREWLASNPAQMPKNSLSNYFKEASLGRFIFWGDVFPEVIVLDSSIAWYHAQGGYSATSKEIIRKLDASRKVNWKLYDNWGKVSGKWVKKGDKMVDHIGIIFRTTPPAIDPKYSWLGSGGGIAGLQGGVEWVKDSLYVHCSGLMSGLIVNGGGTGSPTETMKTLKHETAHFLTLFHYSATNDRTGGPDLGTHGGWGLASASGSSSIAVNSWDRNWLGWANPTLEINPDSLNTAIITLSDFVTTGTSVRIKIPFVEDEWYWLEYHANKGTFDQVDQNQNALYIMHQIGINGPHHLDIEEADGKYDYEIIEQTDTRCCGRHWRLHKKFSNPLMGYGDRDVLHLDKDGNRRLDRTDLSGVPVFMVDADGENEIIHYLGDGGDGYTTQAGRNQFAIGTNPSSASSGSKLRNPISKLNGIQIKILNQTDSTLTFSYRSDFFTIQQNVRWSGMIEARDSIILDKNKQISLFQSGTFLKMLDTFPTANIKFLSGSSLTMKSGSRILIEPGSSLEIMPGAKLILENDARIIIQKNGLLKYNPEQLIILGKKTKILDLNK
jgi:M6 family metalloprotease-like protein